MGVKKCVTCKTEKSYEEFHKNATTKDGLNYTCKPCRKTIAAATFKRRKLDHYVLYYLVNDHYCGITNALSDRLASHKKKGRDVSDVKILATSKDRVTIKHYEAMYQGYLGIGGLSMT